MGEPAQRTKGLVKSKGSDLPRTLGRHKRQIPGQCFAPSRLLEQTTLSSAHHMEANALFSENRKP